MARRSPRLLLDGLVQQPLGAALLLPALAYLQEHLPEGAARAARPLGTPGARSESAASAAAAAPRARGRAARPAQGDRSLVDSLLHELRLHLGDHIVDDVQVHALQVLYCARRHFALFLLVVFSK
jgi:hypothetical protein